MDLASLPEPAAFTYCILTCHGGHDLQIQKTAQKDCSFLACVLDIIRREVERDPFHVGAPILLTIVKLSDDSVFCRHGSIFRLLFVANL